jgi:hypothetical protein
LTGTSTWVDVFVLAPGLHYQQAAESLGQTHPNAPLPEVTNLHTGTISRVTNTATIHYLRRIDRSDRTVIIDVGIAYSRTRIHGQRGRIFQSESLPGSKISTFLYSLGPVLTLTAIILLIVIKDWWGLGLVLALMFARALNVWIIRERTKDQPPPSNNPNEHQCWWVLIDDDHRICLRGLRNDLEAITTGEWMRSKTDIEGYMEAMAKMTVYLVAVFSGNQTQSGDIILMLLLGLSAGLLALSNSFATSFNMNGRTAVITPQGEDPKRESSAPTPTDPNNYASTVSNFEKQEAAEVLETTYPFSNEVNYV